MDNLDAIFKAYDIRGVYPKEINEEIAYKIGRASARFLISKTQDKSFRLRSQKLEHMVVARDNRLSSEDLAKVLIEGIRDEGIDVIDIGIATTPMFYFSAIKWKADGGIMITASHNPKEYNGFKIAGREAAPIGENSGLRKIKGLIRKNKFKTESSRGRLEKREILQEYINHNLNFVHLGNIKPFKIVVDTANGTAGLVIPGLFKHVPSAKLVHIFSELDGSFPNHAPDPGPSHPETIRVIQERVLSEKADLGVAFDGDADRIIFINEKGKSVNPDFIAVLLIHYFYNRAGKIIYTVIASRAIQEEIKDTGNIPVCSKVGHSFVKEKMEEENAVFGFESSGHYYLKDNYFLDSPLIILLKILEILSRTKMPLSELIKPFEKYYQEQFDLKIKNVGNKVSYISGTLRKVEKKYKKDGKISHLDGLTIEFPEWWFNFRASNTEPILRLTIEAITKELLEEKKPKLRQLVGLN